MLSRTKESQIDKATNTMRDFVKYAQEVARDERLRADMRAALDHGSTASRRLKKDVQAGGIYAKLAADKKLRKNLRAMLDDLDDAIQRVRPERTHRLRNALLVLGGAVAAALALPRVRDIVLGTSTGDDLSAEQ
jgi:hypothetical protein